MDEQKIREIESLVGELQIIAERGLSEGWYSTYLALSPRVAEIGREISSLLRGSDTSAAN